MRRRIKKKGDEKLMPLFTIMHIYEVPARNQYEATDELMTARKHHFDKVYLKKVLVRDAEELRPSGIKSMSLHPNRQQKSLRNGARFSNGK
jgi:hypothetical protein